MGRAAKSEIAEIMVDGVAVNAVTAIAFSKFPFGDVDAEECMATLCDTVRRVQQGDLAGVEALLMVQAVTLNTLFAHLAHLATTTEFIEKFDRYLRLALKAQGQCRATCETLAAIKNPPTVFTRQANIAQGPQQVNNTVSVSAGEGRPLARAGESAIGAEQTFGGAG